MNELSESSWVEVTNEDTERDFKSAKRSPPPGAMASKREGAPVESWNEAI